MASAIAFLGVGVVVAVDAQEGDALAMLGRLLLEERKLEPAGAAPDAHLLTTTG